MEVLLIVLLMIILCMLMYMCKYRSVENFTEASISLYESNATTPLEQESHDLHFDKPFNMNATTIDFNKRATFNKDLKL